MQTNNTHIVTLHGEPVTRINIESNGSPDVHTGSRESAIEYTLEEAAEVAKWIGAGAEAELITTGARAESPQKMATFCVPKSPRRTEKFMRSVTSALNEEHGHGDIWCVKGCAQMLFVTGPESYGSFGRDFVWSFLKGWLAKGAAK